MSDQAARPRVSFVLCNYNTASHLEKCLASLKENIQGVSYEVIVTDNASPDNSAAMVREKFPDFRLIANSENRWFTGGNNQGMEAAKGDYVYILAPDTLMTRGTLEPMVDYLDKNPNAGAVTCKMHFPNGQFYQNGCRDFDFGLGLTNCTLIGSLIPPLKRRWNAEFTYAGADWEKIKEVLVVGDCNVMVRKSVLDRIGLFDERMKLYYTENDLCMRIRRAGYTVVYLPVGDIIHHLRASVSKTKIEKIAKIYMDDTLVYFKKYWGWPASFTLKILIHLTNLLLSLRSMKEENVFKKFLTLGKDS